MRRLLLSSALLLGALAVATRADALPVFPGAVGFGTDTLAGRGGTIYRVTNVNASGTGSLKACIDGTGPRVCVFETSGAIKLTTDLIIRNDFITIAGQTAPSPGIMLRGAALKITASNVLVQHLRIRVGDDPNGPDFENRDALKIEGTATKPARNIVIDHCSFSWAVDETVSLWGRYDNVTLSDNIFAEALNESLHPDYDGVGVIPHGYGVILGTSPDSSVTMVRNLFGHTVERNPLSRASQLVFVNNVVYNRMKRDLDLQSDGVTPTMTTALRNTFIRGPSYTGDQSPIYVRTSGSLGLGQGSRAYQTGNVSVDYAREILTLTAGNTISGLLSLDGYPTWNGGLQIINTGNNLAVDTVLNRAGARPADRDKVDKRVVSNVRSRDGQIINCVSNNGTTRCAKNGGGWPSVAVNRRALTLPSNPNTVTSSGYTNLERWLHTMDNSISGTTQSSSPASPMKLTVN